MPDDKTKVGEPDRSRVATNQDYEVGYLATKYGLTSQQVRELVARVGNDREKLEQAARELKRSWGGAFGSRGPNRSPHLDCL